MTRCARCWPRTVPARDSRSRLPSTLATSTRTRRPTRRALRGRHRPRRLGIRRRRTPRWRLILVLEVGAAVRAVVAAAQVAPLHPLETLEAVQRLRAPVLLLWHVPHPGPGLAAPPALPAR